MITMQLNGGLGNQMFQYAMGRALSLRMDEPLTLDVTRVNRNMHRSYCLDNFGIEARLLTAKWKRPPKFKSERAQAFANRLMEAIGRAGRTRETDFGFNPDFLTVKGNVYLIGYWQCEKYFIDHEATIRDELTLKTQLAAERQEVEQQIMTTNAVSLHVRRGDYVSSPSINAKLGTFTPEWFGEAMRRMTNHVETPVFYVFSDDPAWVRDNIRSDHPLVFVDPQDDGKDWEDMALMSRCRSHIIANSSFSWWGAWLNGRPDKHVIAPARWFASPELEGKDIVPERWERL